MLGTALIQGWKLSLWHLYEAVTKQCTMEVLDQCTVLVTQLCQVSITTSL